MIPTMMLCTYHSSQHLIQRDDSVDIQTLAYCQIDILSIVLNIIFLSSLILIFIIRRKQFVDFEHLSSSANPSPNTSAHENRHHNNHDNHYGEHVNTRSMSWKKRRQWSLWQRVCHAYTTNQNLVRQVSILPLLSFKLILGLELLLIWHLSNKLFIIDILSIVLSLVTVSLCLSLSKKCLWPKKTSAIGVLVTVFWTWSVVSSLAKFVIISVYNKQHYLSLVRVYSYFILFIIYSILCFIQLANVLRGGEFHTITLFIYM